MVELRANIPISIQKMKRILSRKTREKSCTFWEQNVPEFLHQQWKNKSGNTTSRSKYEFNASHQKNHKCDIKKIIIIKKSKPDS